MLKKILYGILLSAIFVVPGMAICQDMPGSKWWHNPDMVKQLNLTDEEKSSLDEHFIQSRRKLIDLKSRVEKEQFELETLVESASMDEGAVKAQFKKLEKARADLADERFNFLMHTRKILGNERFQDVKRMYKDMRKQKRHRNKGRFDKE